MNLGKRLHDLQQLDLDLARTTEALSRVDHQLNHNETLEKARADLEAARAGLAGLRDKQKNGEWAIDDIQAKLKPIQQRLYAGSVKNPKELVSMQQQASQLKGQITEEEDRVIEIMSQIEALQDDIALKTARVESIETEWKQTQQGLLSEKGELSEDLDDMGKRRAEILASIDAAHVETYEKIRVRKQGVAVAKIEQGRCQGCRIAVPLSEQTQARAGELVHCGNCGRVLCLG
ncbi:MAG: hypothetical protein A2Y61_03865 [Chloroflexi bacterium RBG_13_60_13]|nr:MAG: hypothetical protein A2Y61_03865 [Chloroflexi bacterium RBG_13_60_13]